MQLNENFLITFLEWYKKNLVGASFPSLDLVESYFSKII